MTFALGAAVGPVPASHTADAPILIPAPIAACVEGAARGSPSSSEQTHASPLPSGSQFLSSGAEHLWGAVGEALVSAQGQLREA